MKVAIEGMHCQACVQRVRKALEKVDGVSVAQVEVGSAVVAADPAREAAVLDAVRKAGYEPRKSE
ncbi:MAG TPA: heavy metal-associated domain-containing protein [Bryobacteraceae bacterium]|jgi:copper chaperone|nr:heavy metal-associated domain-containing protein [Bryobacteraceae bacterium]